MPSLPFDVVQYFNIPRSSLSCNIWKLFPSSQSKLTREQHFIGNIYRHKACYNCLVFDKMFLKRENNPYNTFIVRLNLSLRIKVCHFFNSDATFSNAKHLFQLSQIVVSPFLGLGVYRVFVKQILQSDIYTRYW